MENIIGIFKAKKEALDLESKIIEAVAAYLIKIGALSTNGNGHKEEPIVSDPVKKLRIKNDLTRDITPAQEKIAAKEGYIYIWNSKLQRFIKRRTWGSKKKLEGKVKRPVGRPKKNKGK